MRLDHSSTVEWGTTHLPRMSSLSCLKRSLALRTSSTFNSETLWQQRSFSSTHEISSNAWCELSVENLSGRCPRFRVGLLPDPEGKGTGQWSIWTPSSPHFTSWWTTSASPIRRKGGLALRPPSPPERGDRAGHLRPVGPLL